MRPDMKMNGSGLWPIVKMTPENLEELVSTFYSQDGRANGIVKCRNFWLLKMKCFKSKRTSCIESLKIPFMFHLL